AINTSTGGESPYPLTVAVKKLNQQSQQGHKQMLSRGSFIGRTDTVNHPNVVKLLGYCSEDTERLLLSGSSLHYKCPNVALEKKKTYYLARFSSRIGFLYDIQIDNMHGLQIIICAFWMMIFIRNYRTLALLKRVLKETKLMLQLRYHFSYLVYKLDILLTIGSSTENRNKGLCSSRTPAISYLMTNSDVYSFGVVPYEIITGRRTIIERMKHLAEKILVKWVKLYHVEETGIQKTKRERE
ncbi:LOW QUALITY PROTEIN: hypothetical protein HID58_077814, partial [Brassica napus]